MRKKMSAYDYVINRLSAREYSELQLRTKMREKEYPQEEIDAAISRAQEQRYQDDERFAHSFTRQKAEMSLWGKVRIRMGLIQAGIKDPLLEEALLKVDWKEAWMEAYFRKYKLTQPEDYKDRNRRLGFIARKGFPPKIPDKEALLEWAEERGLT